MWLAFLTLLAVAFVIYPLIRTASKPAADEVYGAEGVIKRANVVLFKEQLAELDKQLFDGDIDDAQYAELVAEQKRLLLADASQADKATETESTPETDVNDAVEGKNGRGAWLVMACLLVVPFLAFSLYQMLGASDDMDITELLEHRGSASSTEDYAALGKKIQYKISRRLESKPDHVFYRVTLARLQMEDNNFESARDSYQQALKWSPDNSELAAEYAQALYFLADSKFDGEPGLALDRALSLDPNNRTALGLQGIRAFGLGDYELALSSWQMALSSVPPSSQQAQALQSGILQAKKMLGEDVLSSKALGKELPVVSVTVSLSEDLKAEPNQSVYIFARKWQGRPMPLAVVKLSVADLPASVRLDDSMAMPGGETLSSVLSSDSAIQIVARVSSTGSAIPSAGDFEGITGEISVDSFRNRANQEVQVLIDRQL